MISKKLPIEQIKTEFMQALTEHNTLVLSAPPGAGKSTCLPLWLLSFAPLVDQKIYLLQPRRLAAKNVACYLAKQLGEPVGKTVGYRLKNESKVGRETQLEVITEGILSQIIQHDPALENCGLVILDEFHERSLNADLAFALTRDVQQGLRDDLKIVLMSATLAINELLKQLPDAIALASQGRSFPVELSYQPPSTSRFWREHTLKVIKHAVKTHQGSILVFLPGTSDIRFLTEKLSDSLQGNMLLCPLYGDLSLAMQQQAIAPTQQGINKIVLATNIAETSLTIEGVNLVIDCGLEKVAVYDNQTMSNQLQQRNIAKDSAIQRMGRAGRLMAGRCIRLYSQEDFERRNEHSISEIQQADLIPLVIEAARWGVKQLSELPMIELPTEKREQQSWAELQNMHLLDHNRNLTPHGKKAAEFSCHPRFAHMIVKAQHISEKHDVYGLSALGAVMTALLEERDIFRGDRARYDSDFRHRVIELLKYQRQPKYSRYISQAQKLLKLSADKRRSFSVDELPMEQVGLLLALAYPQRIAKQRQHYGSFLAKNGKGLLLDDQDALAGEPFIVAANVAEYQDKLQIRLAAPVNFQQLLAWDVIETQSQEKLTFDSKTQRITAVEQVIFGAIVLSEKPLAAKITSEAIIALWYQQIEKQGLSWLNWRDGDVKLLARWRWINQTQQHLAFVDVEEQTLRENLSLWLGPYLSDIKNKVELDKVHLSNALLAQLDYAQQQQLDKVAPEYFIGPTGRRCPIRYSHEQAPIVSLPMQELYGLSTTPSVGDANSKSLVPLIIEILSPAQRPIQITQDLVAFWQGSYKDVQKEMKSKYPKHYWPDDPANASATRKVKKYM